ncbi:dual 3',5'-cyclic-AMP and -GMP phosphodiesterase 11 [Caerostris extrusa]|uniref:Dual 3',5'-cyclic-AMP and -GMP phosphodiesterase 11 n=1 Tax=Caerostris extrusa TaxID=172846 RepID=A0AAV4MQ48_CAEEX|nr:dual 3',5'-cyclic-AMP and -GMP phosphodiesterase 11 [Caerostris extrusa]
MIYSEEYQELRVTSKRVYTGENNQQGDVEKQLKLEPIDMMNRDKKDSLPLMQVEFIDSMCLPIYEAFAMISDKLTPLLDGVKENRAQWLKLAEERKVLRTETDPDVGLIAVLCESYLYRLNY